MNKPVSTQIIVPEGAAEFRLTEKGSRFLSWTIRVESEEAAFQHLSERSRLHHDATHHCWAFRVGETRSPLERSADAGEPSGTAGRPILDAIRGSGLNQTLVIVSRWFGGTKLGKGGLIRAYGNCAAEVLKLVPKRIIIPMVKLSVNCPYDMIGWVERTVKGFGGEIRRGQYFEQATITISLPIDGEPAFKSAVQADGDGKVTFVEDLA